METTPYRIQFLHTEYYTCITSYHDYGDARGYMCHCTTIDRLKDGEPLITSSDWFLDTRPAPTEPDFQRLDRGSEGGG